MDNNVELDLWQFWNQEIRSACDNSNNLCMAVFSIDGELLSVNPAMNLLFKDTPEKSFINPEFDTMVEMVSDNSLVFDGFLTVGNVNSTKNISIHAKVFRRDKLLLIIGEVDINPIVFANHKLFELNSEISDLQRKLIKEKKELTNTLEQLRESLNKSFEEELKVREELRESEARFKNMFEKHSAVMLLLERATGRIVDSNNAAAAFYGYGKSVLCTMNINSIDILNTKSDIKNFENSLSEKENYYVSSHKLINGQVRIVEVHSTPVSFQGNEIKFLIVHDITEREKALDELRKLSVAINQSPACIVITGVDGSIEYVNPMFVELTGYTSDEALGQNPGILKSGNIPEQVYVELWETILSGKVWRGNLHNRKKNGELYWESATIAPIFNDAGEIENFIAIKEDITDRKCAQDKVKKLLTEKELLLKEVHHRIKNNMNTIKGLISLQISAEENTSTIASLNDTESRVQSMIMLYDRLYCSENYRELSIREYLHALTEEIINSFSNRVIVDIKLEIDDFILNVQTLSPLGIIVNELLTNIMKYAFTGRDRGVITLNASKKDNNVTVIISDNGVGIPETVSFSKSTGFGLNLAYMLTEQIGGNIRIERGEGTKFVLEFKV